LNRIKPVGEQPIETDPIRWLQFKDTQGAQIKHDSLEKQFGERAK